MSGATGERGYYDRREVWDAAGSYGAEAEQLRAAHVVELVQRHRPQNVLEIGAGSGLIANRLHRLGMDVLAYDFSAVAMEGVEGPTLVGDVSAIPLEDRSYDVVVASEVLEHLGPGVFERCCSEMARLARTGAVVTVPNREDLLVAAFACPQCRCRSHPHRHVRSFAPADLATLLDGFEAVEVGELGPDDIRQRRFEAAIRRDLMDAWDWPPLAVCPQCGYASVEAGGAPPASAARAGLRQRLVRHLRLRRSRWLVADLRRVS